jgi:arylsulfatase
MSLLPFFGQDIQQERPPLFFHHENKKALRLGEWKITTIEDGGAWELYDLSADRGETNNLADQHPEKLGELVRLWEARRDSFVQQITDQTP